MEPKQDTQAPAREKATHDPPHIFDLTFKKLLSLSKRAVINLILTTRYNRLIFWNTA
jgi:hypothetical protein